MPARMRSLADIVFTPAVRQLQREHGSRAQYARWQERTGEVAGLGADEAELLAAADTFFLATVSETGWPYVQHRGGPPGFVRMLSPRQIAFADFGGNRQYVSAGNVAGDDRVSLIFVDYVRQRRLKMLGHLRFIPVAQAEPALLRKVELPDYRARIERVALTEVVAFDWNCPQHIPRRAAPTTLGVGDVGGRCRA